MPQGKSMEVSQLRAVCKPSLAPIKKQTVGTSGFEATFDFKMIGAAILHLGGYFGQVTQMAL